jgi:hypothetical protein
MFRFRTGRSTRRFVGLLLLLTVVFTDSPRTQTVPFPSRLNIGWRQFEDGKASEAVFQTALECSFDGRCTLTTVTLNQCILGAFYPKIQHWSTNDGGLSVQLIDSSTVTAKFSEGDAVFQLRYSFERSRSGLASVTTFTGGAVKQSSVLGEIITWKLVPLRHTETVILDCPAALDGIPK